MVEATRRMYNGAYRSNLEDDNTSNQSPVEPNNTTDDLNLDPSERNWKQRYGDLRTHTNSLTERIKDLEAQLRAAQKQELKMPSTPEEIKDFSQRYPDVYRHISSIALQTFLQQREDLVQETNSVKEDLEKVKRERGYNKIIVAHSDFEELNNSQDFHDWAQRQLPAIQAWVYDNDDPDLCIRAIDLYKAEKKLANPPPTPKRSQADVQVRTRSSVEPDQDVSGKRIWKASEIATMHPKFYEQHEADIETARREGRIDLTA